MGAPVLPQFPVARQGKQLANRLFTLFHPAEQAGKENSMNALKALFAAIMLIAVFAIGYMINDLVRQRVVMAAPVVQEDVDEPLCIQGTNDDEVCFTSDEWVSFFQLLFRDNEQIQRLIVTDVTARDAGVPEDIAPAADAKWQPEQKCEWLRMNFPQTTAAVQALGARLGNVDTKRIATHIYHCDASTSVFDGFIVLGPNEGFSGAVTMTVPQNGAIDTYSVECGARYSATPMLVNDLPENCDDTWRATEGTVTALRLTYWPFNDDAPPSLAGIAVQEKVSEEVTVRDVGTDVAVVPADVDVATKVACVDPITLAQQQRWTNRGWADETYGGLRVELRSAGELPELWEALSSGREIKQDTEAREMVPGVWTIYPPYDCREELGFSR